MWTGPVTDSRQRSAERKGLSRAAVLGTRALPWFGAPAQARFRTAIQLARRIGASPTRTA